MFFVIKYWLIYRPTCIYLHLSCSFLHLNTVHINNEIAIYLLMLFFWSYFMLKDGLSSMLSYLNHWLHVCLPLNAVFSALNFAASIVHIKWHSTAILRGFFMSQFTVGKARYIFMSLFNHRSLSKALSRDGFHQRSCYHSNNVPVKGLLIFVNVIRQWGKTEPLKKSLGCLSGCVWWNLMKTAQIILLLLCGHLTNLALQENDTAIFHL